MFVFVIFGFPSFTKATSYCAKSFFVSGDFIENKDVVNAINLFIRNFEAEHVTRISNYFLEDNVVKEATMSGIVRLRFDFSDGSYTQAGVAIMKVPSFATESYMNWRATNIYDREVYFYQKLLPALYQLGECEPFAPKLYAATEARALVLEDLSVKGYGNKMKSIFIDLDHSLVALNVLAKYHALGYEYFKSLSKDDPSLSLIGPSQPAIRTSSRQNQFDSFRTVVQPFLSRSLYQKILRLENEILAELPTINSEDKNSMIVIIHGDFHARNVLFKYDSIGKVNEGKLIDWQFGRAANPVLDLIDFFIPNMEIEMFEANENTLLNSYLATFNSNLSSSTNREYKRSELDRDMYFFKNHYFRVLSTVGREILALEPQAIDTYAEKLAKWVIYLEKRGFI